MTAPTTPRNRDGFYRARIRRSHTGELARFVAAFGNRPREPRQRLTNASGDSVPQTPQQITARRLAVAKKLLHAFQHSYATNADGDQTRGVLPLDQSDAMSAGNLSSFCQFCEKVWQYAQWSNTVVLLDTPEVKREYDGRAAAVERLTTELVTERELVSTLQDGAESVLRAIEDANADAASEKDEESEDTDDEDGDGGDLAELDLTPLVAYRAAVESETERVAAATVARNDAGNGIAQGR